MWKICKRLFNLRGNLGSLFGGSSKDNQVANLQVPQFQTNQSFTTAQNQLATLGTNILSGNLPSYYSSLGKANSPAFQGLEANVIGQTNQASAEQAAASGTDRSGVAATAAASNLANVLPQMSYQDYLNAQNQQMGLLNTGAGITENVEGAGLQQEGLQNQFALNQFGEQMSQAEYNNQYNQMIAQQKGQALGSILGVGLDMAAAPFTGGMSLAGIPSSLGLGSGTGSGGSGGGLSSLLNGLGQMYQNSPGNLAQQYPGGIYGAMGTTTMAM